MSPKGTIIKVMLKWCESDATTLPTILFCSREIAETIVGEPSVSVISVADPDSPVPNLCGGFYERLYLRFYDVADPASHNPMTMDDAADVVDFLLCWATKLIVKLPVKSLVVEPKSDFVPDQLPVHVIKLRDLLIHCEHGLSRSAAIAKVAHRLVPSAKVIGANIDDFSLANPHVENMLYWALKKRGYSL